MRKLLFLSPVFPLPLDRGQHVRIFQILRSCTDEFDVTFVSPKPTDPLADTGQVRCLCSRMLLFDPAIREPGAWMARAAVRWRYGLLQSGRKLRALSGCATALTELSLEEFSSVWLERTFFLPLVRQVRARTILDLDDLEHLIHAQYFRLHWFGAASWISIPLFVRHAYREMLLSRRFKRAVVCSYEDKAYLERLGSRNVMVVPNGTDARRFLPRQPRQGFRLAFTGNMAYEPNLDAYRLLANRILPDLECIIPELSLHIIGKWPHMIQPPRASIHLTGFVKDLGAYLAGCDLFVAPLRMGSGTKLKLIEAMACGIPIVTTSRGARGLGLQHGVSAMIAETCEEFAAAIIACWKDRDLADRIADRALSIVEQRFRWDDIRLRLTSRLRELE